MTSTLSRLPRTLLIAATALAASAHAWADKKTGPDRSMIERGRYLVQIAGCNDCHTPGYLEKGGKVDEKLWLTGDSMGWRGPWGTTYALNLRLYVEKMNESEWSQRMKTMQPRPPMPWFNMQAMSDRDQRAIFHYPT